MLMSGILFVCGYSIFVSFVLSGSLENMEGMYCLIEISAAGQWVAEKVSSDQGEKAEKCFRN